jgi:hypothetical protein
MQSQGPQGLQGYDTSGIKDMDKNEVWNSKMRIGDVLMNFNLTGSIVCGRIPLGFYGFARSEIFSILATFAILALVAIPRYTTESEGSNINEAVVFEYMYDISKTLSDHIEDHYVNGTEWVRTGDDLMSLLPTSVRIPDGMRYEDNTWKVGSSDYKWKFVGPMENSAPRIVRSK